MDAALILLCGLGWTMLIAGARWWWGDQQARWAADERSRLAVSKLQIDLHHARIDRDATDEARRAAEARALRAERDLADLHRRLDIWERWVAERESHAVSRR